MRDMRKTSGIALLAAFALASANAGSAAGERNLCDTVEPHPTCPGALRASEVCMRSLVPRSARPGSPHDTLQAIRDFHVTRLEWTYSLTPAFIAAVKELGVTVSGACVNGSLAGVDRKAPEWYLRYSALDLDGNPVEAPWMRPWPGHALWECINNPEARAACLQYVKNLVDLGVTDLQRDGPEMNHSAVNWGGCFCRYCVAGFRDYLKAHGDPEQLEKAGVVELDTFDYAAYLRAKGAPVGDAFRQYPHDYLKGAFIDFQEQSTIAFHQWWRCELNAYAGRYVPVSTNNGVFHSTPVHRVFDSYIGELSWAQAQPEPLWEAARQARAEGKGQTTTMPLRRDDTETPEWIRRTRQTIATDYALGMHIEAPWDTYLPIVTEQPARYFGKAADYADLFALVRATGSLLDGYEEAAVTGGLLQDQRWTAERAPVTVFAEGRRVYCFTRALPGKPEEPVVAHLVDWTDNPQPFTVSLNSTTLFAARPLRVSIVTPKAYDKAAHAAAFDTHNYSSLVTETVLAEGKVATVPVPALRPWGLLMIRPLPEAPGPWAPHLALVEQGGNPALSLTSPDSDAAIRFTTDGTEPTRNSHLYSGPLPLDGLTQVRARAYDLDMESTVSETRHLSPTGLASQELLANADFAAGTANWTPVVFEGLGDPEALTVTVENVARLGAAPAARLAVGKSDGVPYHLRLTQPISVEAGARLYLTSTLMADRPTQVRLGVQETRPPHRVVMIRVLEIGPEPTPLRISLQNEHPDLQAQYQLDLGYAAPGTTVWLSGVRLRKLRSE
ncbi:MAG: hypothetical protein GW867_13870 [Armatimonadetes bacterium]|nr:hypothetical protein [Armatimonadota bacterium]